MAHCDYVEMIEWLKKSKIQPKRVFVTHSEPAPSDSLRRSLNESIGWDTIVPHDGAKWELD